MTMDPGKKTLYRLFGASEEDRFFATSSADEALCHIYWSHFLDCIRESGRTQILVSPGIPLYTLKRLEKMSVVVKLLPVSAQGQVTREILQEAIRPRTSLVVIPWADGESGVIHPIVDIAEVCSQHDVRLCVDARHAFGRHYFHFCDALIDFLVFDAGLFCRAKIPFHPLYELKQHFPEGSNDSLDYVCTEIARLKSLLEESLVQGWPGASIRYVDAMRLPDRFLITFPKIHAELLAFTLQRKMPCSAAHHEALSITLPLTSTEESVQRSAEIILQAVAKLAPLTEALS